MIWPAFIMGLAGSLHCIGMCGPLVMLHSHQSTIKKITYHLGRSFTYGILGITAGFMGASARLFAMQQHITIAAGVLLIVASLIPGWLARGEKAGMHVWTKLRKKITAGKAPNRIPSFVGGMMNGLLPCGMVYVALIAALGMPDLWLAPAFMILFGLGTIPALLGISFGWKLLPQGHKLRIQQKLKYLTIVIGILFIVRGLGLGIPYISPEVEFRQNQQVPVSSCCKPEK